MITSQHLTNRGHGWCSVVKRDIACQAVNLKELVQKAGVALVSTALVAGVSFTLVVELRVSTAQKAYHYEFYLVRGVRAGLGFGVCYSNPGC